MLKHSQLLSKNLIYSLSETSSSEPDSSEKFFISSSIELLIVFYSIYTLLKVFVDNAVYLL